MLESKPSAMQQIIGPRPLPESMSKDEMLSYYSSYANLCAHEALQYQKRIRDLEAAARAMQEQQAGVPTGWKLVLVPEVQPADEPDWDECIRQAEVATGLRVERHTLSIVIREVRRWLAGRAASPSAPHPEDDVLPPGWPAGACFTDGEGGYYDEHARPIAGDSVQQPVAQLADATVAEIVHRCRAAHDHAKAADEVRAILGAARIQQAAQPEAVPAWQPSFDACSANQERLAREFCLEIAGHRGQHGSPPDPVRLLEMAQALYEAERADLAPSNPEAQQAATPVARDSCEICHGARGGVPGNENIVGGKRVCDYCHASPTAPAPAGAEALQDAPTDEWERAQAICDLPAVNEAIRNLLEDNTGDNATCLVREVMRAISGVAAPAGADIDAKLEQLIEESDGQWREDVFLIEASPLWELLRQAAALSGAPAVAVAEPPRANAPEPQLVGYAECRCVLTQYCDGRCRPVFALPAVLEQAKTLYANSPQAYRGTRPLPWDRAPMPTKQEFIDRAKAHGFGSPSAAGKEA